MDDSVLDAVREADGDTDADEAEGLYEDDEDAAEVEALLDEESGFDDDSSVAEIGARAADVTAAALLGAALGAGLGWLAYRSTRTLRRELRGLTRAARRWTR
jgi:hypothetical protein